MSNNEKTTGLFRWCPRVSMQAVRENTHWLSTYLAQDALRSVRRKLAEVKDGRERTITSLTSAANPPAMIQDNEGFMTGTCVIVYEVFVGFALWEQALPGEHVSLEAIDDTTTPTPIGNTIILTTPHLIESTDNPAELYISSNDIYHFLRVTGGWRRLGSVELYGPPTYEQYWRGITPFIEVAGNLEASPTDIELEEKINNKKVGTINVGI